MNKTLIFNAIALSFLTACSSSPDLNTRLEQARSSFQAAQNETQVRALAPEEMAQAEVALRIAESAWTNDREAEDINHLAYLSIQRTAIAQQSAAARAAEAITASASAERDRMLLQARTNQAAASQRDLSRAQQNAARSEAQRAAALEQSRRSQQELAQARQSNQQTTSQLATANAAAAAAEQREQDRTASDNARLAELEAQLSELNARPTPRGMVVTLGDVLFNTGQSQLLAGASENMRRLAEFMTANPEQNADIEGYTDSVGSATSNYALAQRRADSVKAELVNLGVASNRLTTRSFGADNPVADNDTQTGRQMNRRVEIVFAD